MSIIHQTTMSPSKLELLAAWLPAQPWYLGTGRQPRLSRVGGFRLDDPRGEVGIEFMVVADASGDRAVAYQVPMTYRAAALDGAGGALVGTGRHGVLGPRWIYDGTADPVLVAQLVALLHGGAEPQAQSVSDTPDPTVTVRAAAPGSPAMTEFAVAASGPSGTDLRVGTATSGGRPGVLLAVRVLRILQPDGTAPATEAGQPCLAAGWRLPDGTTVRGTFATARYAPVPAARTRQ